jgi:hypothetical protein
MNKSEIYRIKFHRDLWPAVCRGQGWNVSDSTRRRDLRSLCWSSIGEPDLADSMPQSDAQATALFTLCAHLAEPDNLTLSLRWANCQANYRAFNAAIQADWWEHRAYGARGSSRLRKQRFHNRPTALGSPAEPAPNPTATRQRLLTMRSRAKSREAANCPF